REEREGRRDFLAGLAPAIRERAEHRDLVVLNQDLADLEGLRLPRPPNPFEGADDGFGPLVRPGPGQIALELRVVLVERDVGDVRGRHAFHIGQIARVGEQSLDVAGSPTAAISVFRAIGARLVWIRSLGQGPPPAAHSLNLATNWSCGTDTGDRSPPGFQPQSTSLSSLTCVISAAKSRPP